MVYWSKNGALLRSLPGLFLGGLTGGGRGRGMERFGTISWGTATRTGNIRWQMLHMCSTTTTTEHIRIILCVCAVPKELVLNVSIPTSLSSPVNHPKFICPPLLLGSPHYHALYSKCSRLVQLQKEK